MTWFEVEQVYGYIDHVETSLENWALNRMQMLSVSYELKRLHQKINMEIHRPVNPPQKNFLKELFGHIRHCQDCIEERLKY